MRILAVAHHAAGFGKHRAEFGIGQRDRRDHDGADHPGPDRIRSGQPRSAPRAEQPARTDDRAEARQHQGKRADFAADGIGLGHRNSTHKNPAGGGQRHDCRFWGQVSVAVAHACRHAAECESICATGRRYAVSRRLFLACLPNARECTRRTRSDGITEPCCADRRTRSSWKRCVRYIGYGFAEWQFCCYRHTVPSIQQSCWHRSCLFIQL